MRSIFGFAKVVAYFAWFGLVLLWRRPKERPGRARWLHEFCSAMLRGMGVALSVEGPFPARGTVISNHQTYLDIICFSAIHPCVFCSKAEIRKWPVVGWMTTMAGTVYVERGRGGSAVKASAGMKSAAEAGLPVVFFPEGTTSNGEHVLPFHSGLLAQALEADEPVTAAYVSYSFDVPQPPDVTLQDDVAYWGDIPLAKHIFRFVRLRGVRATVRFADGPVVFSADEIHRKKAAAEARDAVACVAVGLAHRRGEREANAGPFAALMMTAKDKPRITTENRQRQLR